MSDLLLKRTDFPIDVKSLFLFLPFLFIYKGYWQFTSVFILVTFLFFVLSEYRFNHLRIELPNIFMWSLLLLWGLFIALKSPVTNDGIKYFFATIFIPFLIFIIILNIKLTPGFLDRFFSGIYFAGAVLGAFSLYLFIESGFNTKLRIPSLWDDFNIMSTFLMIASMFNLSYILNKEKNEKLFPYLITLGFTYAGVFLSQTRGVWLAIIVSLVVFIIKKPKIIFPALIISMIVGLLFSNVIMDRFLSVKNFSYDASSLGRLQAWYSSFVLIKANPLFGYGFDAYIRLRDTVFSYYIVQVLHSHNTYLRMLLEMGLIGFVLYFSFFFRAAFFAFRMSAKSFAYKYYKIYIEGLQLSFIGLLVTFMFEPYFSLYGASTVVIWILIALSFKVRIIDKQQIIP
jgi:O-antigen ligase